MLTSIRISAVHAVRCSVFREKMKTRTLLGGCFEDPVSNEFLNVFDQNAIRNSKQDT